MSKKIKSNQKDLIEDTTVEALRANGLVEEVSVGEEPAKKLDTSDVATDGVKAVSATNAAVAGSAPKAADQGEHVGTAPGPVGTEAPEEVKKSLATVDAAADAAPTAEELPAGSVQQTQTEAANGDEEMSDDETEEDDSDEEEETPETDDSIKENLDIIFRSEQPLSEEFKSKASQLFEAAVNSRVAEQLVQIEENYQTQLSEELNEATKDLSEKLDSYLNYVVKTWMEENKVAIESGLRTELAENFIVALKGVFNESYIEVPEGKENLVDTLTQKVTSLEEQLQKQTDANVKLNENVNSLRRANILAEASKDLASTEAHKLNSLVEQVAFENEESFAKKVVGIKETFIRKPVIPAKSTEVESSMLSESEENLTPVMAAYSSAISRTLKS